MSSDDGPRRPPRARPDIAALAFGIPALTTAFLDAAGAAIVLACGALVALVVVWPYRPAPIPGWPPLPLALAAVLLPALADPGALLPALASAAAGLGLVFWMGLGARGPDVARRALSGLWLPGVATVGTVTVAFVVTSGGGNPGVAGLLIVGALLLLAWILAGGDRAPSEEAPPEPTGGATG